MYSDYIPEDELINVDNISDFELFGTPEYDIVEGRVTEEDINRKITEVKTEGAYL